MLRANVRRGSHAFQREEGAIAPYARRVAAGGERELGKLIIDRARQLCLEPMSNRKAGGWAAGSVDDVQRMFRAKNNRVPAVEPECQALFSSFAFAAHLDRPECGGLDFDIELLRRSDEHMAAIGFAPEHRREEADHRGTPDRAALVVPGAVPPDTHARVAATIGIPLVDRRQAALVDQSLQIGETYSLQLDRWAALGHRVPPWIA